MRDVVIFRHNLFRVSETFITEQARFLRRHAPLYVGRLRYGPPPPGAASLALADLWPRFTLPRIGWQMLTRDPAPYERLLAGRRPALIHAHFGVEGVYALPVARRLGLPLITTFHGFDATLSTAALMMSPAWVNYPLFRGRLARQGDLFLCASAFIRERVLAMGFPVERTRVHYIGVDCQAIRPRDPEEETPTILHVARLVEVKGAEYLIRAFSLLADWHPKAQLDIIGDGPLRKPLQRLAGTLGLSSRIRFLGALPHTEVLARMRRAAMLVLPSVRTNTGRVEGLGMVMLEAAATGVPVIGSRIGGIPEAIVEDRTGLLAPERDATALARHMETLLDNRDLRHRMGWEARAHVGARFDITRQTAALEDIYDQVAGHAA
ncbi:glycosyltransferase involved in cell wall biosynthesis [Nitrospirillum amazonense]|uniref:Glycosyltransferase involved in cell wall biosynthesis n=1 Tax=Nitrospirillum amazonense TaxID=28077 RepID=A0A560EHN4_9PROT|nr:glycosyltransferase [Nitrospirillum amazonense]TWB08893.1 glycosyltransferase involved in cell wall biosynthesis [Nitrospirillum amazonense]